MLKFSATADNLQDAAALHDSGLAHELGSTILVSGLLVEILAPSNACKEDAAHLSEIIRERLGVTLSFTAEEVEKVNA